jgi:hypothetical protein
MTKREIVIARGKLPANFSYKDMLPVLGEPSLLENEDRAEYEALMASLSHTVVPQDTIEWIWIKDITDIVWEMRRLKIVRNKIVERLTPENLDSLVRSVWTEGDEWLDAEELAVRVRAHWNSGDDSRRAIVRRFLSRRGLSIGDVHAQIYHQNLKIFSQTDGLIAELANRRDRLLKEIEGRRNTLAMWLREATDAEFEVVDELTEETGGQQTANQSQSPERQDESRPRLRRRPMIHHDE